MVSEKYESCNDGANRPPYQQPTPQGIYLVQRKLSEMLYLKDGTDEEGGFAPYACRFTGGAYLHGVPVNYPGHKLVEYSWTLGTIPRSHMCVRNATHMLSLCMIGLKWKRRW